MNCFIFVLRTLNLPRVDYRVSTTSNLTLIVLDCENVGYKLRLSEIGSKMLDSREPKLYVNGLKALTCLETTITQIKLLNAVILNCKILLASIYNIMVLFYLNM